MLSQEPFVCYDYALCAVVMQTNAAPEYITVLSHRVSRKYAGKKGG